MHLKSLSVKNFRALEAVDITFEGSVIVIVGPNAVGKTTVLEAIRLAKALLAPRSQQESQQSLVALGALSPFDPQRLHFDAIARDINSKVEIRCGYRLSSDELGYLDVHINELAANLALRSVGQIFAGQSQRIAYLSSPRGKAALKQAEEELNEALETIRTKGRICNLNVTIDQTSGIIDTGNPVDGVFISSIEQRFSPNLTGFSYFPADRAMPSGEQPVQLGAADAVHQIESYVSQPQLKYMRLKNTMFTAQVTSDLERDELKKEFSRILGGLLKGRNLKEIGINKHGLLSITVQDIETGRMFDLDAMSSGEKGLILTFFLIGRSLADGAIFLLDEPELHLNPAVCKDLLPFLVDNYVTPKNLQGIICSHSPEILAGVFERDVCSLYHLMSERIITKVRQKDQDEISQALRKLGSSETESLLYKATIFVEGEHDVDLLQTGFGDSLRRYKLKELHGRHEVEKQIEALQAAESKGDHVPATYFIFDRDETPSGLRSSGSVKILQWGRRCLENYLIDMDTLMDLLKDVDVTRAPVERSGQVSEMVKELAMNQLVDYVAKKVYLRYGFENPGMRGIETEGKPLSQVAEMLFDRLEIVRSQTGTLTEDWKRKFIEDCDAELKEMRLIWQTKWQEDCDGKRLFGDLQKRIPLKMSVRKFKQKIMSEIQRNRRENWRSMESLLNGLLGTEPKTR
ncbi:MAG TPA: AAA family ATPase [Candidatus Saccharimonadales bacterium]|jgi:predicted ATPase|nr:AAA family ATPase [Candidatus Saccharimonadales bacterium]